MQAHDREQEQRQHQMFQRQRIHEAMSSLPCPECGSRDGMFEWYWEDIGDPFAYELWYRLHSLPNYLYTPCWQCNSAGAVDAAYTFLTNRQVRAWLSQRKGDRDANAH